MFFYLQPAYHSDDAVHRYLRQVMALHFLPAEHIPSAFERLREDAVPEVEPLMDYCNTIATSYKDTNMFLVP